MTKKSDKYYITPQKAVEYQQKLRRKIKMTPLPNSVETVAGADISFNRGSDILHAGFVILRLSDLQVIARSLATMTVNFPYVPGLLAFREIPALRKAWQQLEIRPDVVVLDGHGIAHPRRMGIATHFGIEVDQPTIGCAKNILTGNFEQPTDNKGCYTYIKEEGENIGMAYRSRRHVKPIFISPGHNVSFENTHTIVGRCLTKYKLPETTRHAHRIVNKLRKGELEEGYQENSELDLFG